MKSCSCCGKEIPENTAYCPHCGQIQNKVENVKESAENKKRIRYCTACGEKIEGNSAFCPACGKQLKDAVPDIHVEPEHNNMEEKSTKTEKIVPVIQSAVFLALVICYTINLAYGLFSAFSFFTLIASTFTVLICIAMWMIYCSGRRGTLNTVGFSMINVVTAIRFAFRIVLSIIFVILAIAVKAEIEVYLFLAIIIFLDLFYWGSVMRIFSGMTANAKGHETTVKVGIYPIVILGVNAVIRLVVFTWASFLQMTANQITGTLNQYGYNTSSAIGEMFADAGLGYDLGYGQSSAFVQSILNPVNGGVQNILGYGQNPLIMIIALAIPVLEMILLIKLHSYMSYKKK